MGEGVRVLLLQVGPKRSPVPDNSRHQILKRHIFVVGNARSYSCGVVEQFCTTKWAINSPSAPVHKAESLLNVNTCRPIWLTCTACGSVEQATSKYLENNATIHEKKKETAWAFKVAIAVTQLLQATEQFGRIFNGRCPVVVEPKNFPKAFNKVALYEHIPRLLGIGYNILLFPELKCACQTSTSMWV